VSWVRSSAPWPSCHLPPTRRQDGLGRPSRDFAEHPRRNISLYSGGVRETRHRTDLQTDALRCENPVDSGTAYHHSVAVCEPPRGPEMAVTFSTQACIRYPQPPPAARAISTSPAAALPPNPWVDLEMRTGRFSTARAQNSHTRVLTIIRLPAWDEASSV
jgi:hypothetical protein